MQNSVKKRSRKSICSLLLDLFLSVKTVGVLSDQNITALSTSVGAHMMTAANNAYSSKKSMDG